MKNNPPQRAAHVMVGNAIRDGRLEKKPCKVCGDPKAEAHHEDYYKSLDVTWLCKPHHRALHIKIRGRELVGKEVE